MTARGVTRPAVTPIGEYGRWTPRELRPSLWLDAPRPNTLRASSGLADHGTAVAEWLDRSGRTNHATQSTTAAMPTSVRAWNLLARSEDHTESAWSTSGSMTVTGGNATNPDGVSNAADTLHFVESDSNQQIEQRDTEAAPVVAGEQWTFSGWLRSDTTLDIRLVIREGSGTTATKTITVGSSWTRYSFTHTVGSDNANPIRVRYQGESSQPAADVEVWGSQLVRSDAPLSYQSTNATAGGVLRSAVRADGSDDELETSVGLTQPYTLVALVTPSANTVGLTDQAIVGIDSSGNWFVNAGTKLAGSAADLHEPAIVEAVFNGASSALYVNGTEQATGDAGSGNVTNLKLLTDGTNPWNGDVLAVVAVDEAMGSDARERLRRYLDARCQKVSGQGSLL